MTAKTEMCERCVHLHSGQVEVCTAPTPCHGDDQFCSVGTLWDRMRAAEARVLALSRLLCAAEALADRLGEALEDHSCPHHADYEEWLKKKAAALAEWRAARGGKA